MVSIVIPLYNAEEYIERCISSLINQTVKDIEILVVNDGSTDRSLCVVERIAKSDERVKVFSQENKGVSAARNLGIQHASGKAICFVDSDDYVENSYIENMYAVWSKETLVACDYVRNDARYNVLQSPVRHIILGDTRADDFLEGNLGREITFSCCNKMFSLELLCRYNISFPENIKIGEDMIFVLRYLSYIKQIDYVAKELYHYCIRDTSVMNAKVRDYFADYCDTINELSRVELNGGSLSEEAMSLWAMKVLTDTFSNKYFAILPFAEFSVRYRMYAQSLLFKYAAKCRKNRNLKRAVLGFVLQTKSKSLLFAIIRLNHLLIS